MDVVKHKTVEILNSLLTWENKDRLTGDVVLLIKQKLEEMFVLGVETERNKRRH